MTTNHKVIDVFTPTTVARLTFVERQRVNQRLVNALMTPGKQVVVYGRSGGGKTTLLINKLHQLYERHVTSKCIQSSTFEQCMLDAFDQLAPFYLESRSTKKSASHSTDLVASYAGIKASLGSKRSAEEQENERRSLPPQLTPSLLARLLGEAKACWILEDFHKVERAEETKLAQLMKLFMDSAEEHPSVRIIAIGAMGSARDIVELEPEMWNRIAEIEVDLMTDEELNEIMSIGERLLNLEFGKRIREKIVHCSNGLPSVCHQLCLNLCLEKGLYETAPTIIRFTEAQLAESVKLWLEDATDSLRAAYNRATRTMRKRQFDNCRLIVEALGGLSREGGTYSEILRKIHEVEPAYRPSNLTQYLKQLMSRDRDFTLIHDTASGRYSFSSPMLHAYVRTLKTHKQEIPTYEDVKDLTLKRLIEAFAGGLKGEFVDHSSLGVTPSKKSGT